MKVIIIGAGISGLSTYLYLRKLVPSITDITIYESHRPRTTSSLESQNYEDLSASTAIVGGGLGVSPNGMYVLKDLDPEIYTAVIEQGFLCDHFTFKGANGWTLSKVPTNDKRQKEGAGLEKCVSSSRHGVWLCLKRKVPDEEIVYRRVSEVGISEDGKPAVKFQDGSPAVIADFVIGADGVKSTVLKAIMGDQYSEIYAPHYEGLAGVGGFLNVDIPSEILQDKSMIFTFGGTGFFGYAAHGSPSNKSLMWWSTFQADIMPEHGTINLADYRKQLVERHGYWKDPVVRKVVELAEFDTVYPTWTTPELPTWSENRVLLIGDAAHALQPTSGQGVSQGLEDSQTLALLLAHYLSDASLNEEDVLKCTAKAMYDIRHPRVTSIAKQARKIDGKKMNQGVFIEYMVYFILWFVPKWPTLGT
ncbi:FAD binding domain protein [Patellaria atrata CBS 101060]|uniref:FAD binding domain protein n=1 Tax=Patellaria atrata CBS 101060 TaxID=1346257 RepID=A0A9P4VSZ3_9PEZI|nr:FAD binding domain protein [Patellaria atrata CBS 101060]